MAKRGRSRFRRSRSFRRLRHHSKPKIPVVGVAVAVLPLLRGLTKQSGGDIFQGIGRAFQYPTQTLRDIVFESVGVDPMNPAGGVDGTKIVATVMPFIVYGGIKKFFGRRISKALRPLGIGF